MATRLRPRLETCGSCHRPFVVEEVQGSAEPYDAAIMCPHVGCHMTFGRTRTYGKVTTRLLDAQERTDYNVTVRDKGGACAGS
jgi:hypothetical protein